MQKNFKNYKTSSRLHFKTKRDRTDRKIENKKNFHPIRSNPTRVRNFKNKCKKILKIKKHHPSFILSQNGPVQAEKERTKIISSLSVRTRPELENSKINAKKFQKLKNILQASFQDETGNDRMKIENKKNCLPIRSNTTRVRKFKNKCRKILKIKKHHPCFISRRNV